MEDSAIVDLYWQRSEQAISETDRKYGRYCHTIAYNICADGEDAEECVNDTWFSAWNSMPDKRPSILSTFLGYITRNFAIDRFKARKARKRGGGEMPLALEELEECISSPADPAQEVEQMELESAVDAFVRGLPDTERRMFIARYWFLIPVAEISERMDCNENNTLSDKKQTAHIFTGGRLMLDSITLLCAVGEIGEESVLDTIRVLHLLDDQPHQRHRNRKMWRIVLIAAIIAALLTACAVGYTIHQRRQLELKAALQIESNSVEGYTEYAETDVGTDQANKTAASNIAPHIQLLSSIQQGENQLVYFSVGPVTEEEAHSYIYDSFVTAFVSLASNKPIPEAYWMNDSERSKDSSKNFADPAMIMLAANTDTKEAAIITPSIDLEQTKADIMSRCYDAETQSLMLQSYISRNNVDFSMPVYFSVRCLDFESMRILGEDYTVTEHPTAFELGDQVYSHDYGTTILRGKETVFVSANFASPIALYNETTDGQCKILSVRLSANCAEWRLSHDNMCANPVGWYGFYDELMNSAYLTFEDGSTIKMSRLPWVNFEGDAVILFTEWPGTIDISKTEYFCIMGKQFTFS